MNRSWEWSRMSLALIVVFVSLCAPYLWAQTLGNAPQLNVAVQGQTGAQPEGAFFNFINWIGNVVAPVGAGGAVFAGIIGYVSGTGIGTMAARGSRAARGIRPDATCSSFGFCRESEECRNRGNCGLRGFRKTLSPDRVPVTLEFPEVTYGDSTNLGRHRSSSDPASACDGVWCLWFSPVSLYGWKVDRRS